MGIAPCALQQRSVHENNLKAALKGRDNSYDGHRPSQIIEEKKEVVLNQDNLFCIKKS